MFKKEDVTKNIYSCWYEIIKNKGKGSPLKPIRSLEALSVDELNEIQWLLSQELQARRSK